MKKAKQLFLTAILSSILFAGFSQSAAPSFDVFFKTLDGEKGDPSSDQAQVDVIYAITVAGTDNISKIHVKLGKTDNGSEKAGLTIPFDAKESELPAGITYRRKENTIYIGLGQHTGLASYHAQIRLEDNNGNMGDPVKKSK